MPRPHRDLAPGFHHIGVSAAGPAEYFRDETDRIDWIRRFARIVANYEWTCLAFCEMSTHWHALVSVPDDSLARAMHRLNSDYSRAFNARHGRVGYLVRDRYWSFRKGSGDELLPCFRYVVDNPRRAGIVRRCEDWFWSSWSTTIGIAQSFPFVDASAAMRLLGRDETAALRALRTYVDAI